MPQPTDGLIWTARTRSKDCVVVGVSVRAEALFQRTDTMTRSPNVSQAPSRNATHAGEFLNAGVVRTHHARGTLLSLAAGGLIAVLTSHASAQSAYPPMETSQGVSQAGASQPNASQPSASQPNATQRNLSSMERNQEYASLDERIESVVRRTLDAQQRAEAAARERMTMERSMAANDFPVPLNLE